MNASKLTSRKNRREERKKGKGSTTVQALTIISACVSSISLRSFSLPWWGLTPPRGQAPVDVVHVHVLILKHAPGIKQRRRERHVRSVKAIRTMQSGGGTNEGLHLNRHGGNLWHRPRTRDGSEEGRRCVRAESTPDDPGSKRRDRRMHKGRRNGSVDRRFPLEFRQFDPRGVARGGDAPKRNAARVVDDARPRRVLRRRAVRRISREGGHAAGHPRSHVQRDHRRRASERYGDRGDRNQRVSGGPPWSPGGPRHG